ncbi:MAG: hypothetical protein B7Z26_08380 [Asticcacaulis sp. 32-58-5]|nr:MAG: hypothetical protein B7Z26_08380 [Asticcacaulis sp. 32-58-5]
MLGWELLASRLKARFIKVQSPLDDCVKANGTGADALFARIKNPYFLRDEPGLTQTLGWVDAWTSRASSYAVAAESAEDVAAAIAFLLADTSRWMSGSTMAVDGGLLT